MSGNNTQVLHHNRGNHATTHSSTGSCDCRTCNNGGRGNHKRFGSGSTTSYNQQYLAIKQYYDRLPLMEDRDLDRHIASLDVALQTYEKAAAATAGPAYCSDSNGNKIGSASSDGRLQVYTKVECNSLPNANWNANGE